MAYENDLEPIESPYTSESFVRAYAKNLIEGLQRDLETAQKSRDFWRAGYSSAVAQEAGLKAALSECQSRLEAAQKAKEEAEHLRDLECAKRVQKEAQTKRFEGKDLATWIRASEEARERHLKLLDKEEQYSDAMDECMLFEARCKTICDVLKEHTQQVDGGLSSSL